MNTDWASALEGSLLGTKPPEGAMTLVQLTAQGIIPFGPQKALAVIRERVAAGKVATGRFGKNVYYWPTTLKALPKLNNSKRNGKAHKKN